MQFKVVNIHRRIYGSVSILWKGGFNGFIVTQASASFEEINRFHCNFSTRVIVTATSGLAGYCTVHSQAMHTFKATVRFGGLIFICLFFSRQLLAHNGAIGYAYLLDKIIVDGDFNDWPKDIILYKLGVTISDTKPLNEADFSGSFTIGYRAEDHSLYVALQVTDDDFIQDTTEIRETPFGRSFGHGGTTAILNASLRVEKDLKMGYVIFTNSNTSDVLLHKIGQFLVDGKE